MATTDAFKYERTWPARLDHSGFDNPPLIAAASTSDPVNWEHHLIRGRDVAMHGGANYFGF